jgi:hypothetical protein
MRVVYPIGRDPLPRDPAWHVHKREQIPYPLYTRERPWEKPENELRDVPRRIARERVPTMGWE